MAFEKEIEKRRTFAVIAHPDAGKTTLTEKLLLFGGAIQTAGAVKSNKIKKSTTSDFMEIEKQRGISVATSVMTFFYKDKMINILDTPGHKDFAEDTYRTLTAVDSVILVVDNAKVVEAQTERLMEVCRMRDTPVIIFVNKVDRDGVDPFDILDELESKLKINVQPLAWPIGMGPHFKGVYNLFDRTLNLFSPSSSKIEEDQIIISDLSDKILDEHLPDEADQLREDVELIEGVYDPFDQQAYAEGKLAPVFFGSAINNFGVKELLDSFVRIAPLPLARETNTRTIEPNENKFSGFVFKIHANIDPNHRNRIAFLRVCSGEFERGKFYNHVRLNKKMRFNNPASFMADSKNIVEEAYAGDVIGLYDSGTFKIGDTVTEGEKYNFQGIPSFSPEIFKELVNKDPMKTKQLNKGIHQLTDEGVAQLFTQEINNAKIVGTVGELQFEVIQYRLKNEYGASCNFQPVKFYKACWVTSENDAVMKTFLKAKRPYLAKDKDDNYVFLATSEWILKLTREEYPEIEFHFTSEFKNRSDVPL